MYEAANTWAGTTGLSVKAALRSKAGLTSGEMRGLCNALAGTSGQDATGALNSMLDDPVTDLVTEVV